ncbi:hypothetical protein E2C01_088682 [Portunus trituberculatus]|uniref:Uncharacterized protein n=1 Tax=Portunus trituberculatus TaxID=210409 RepID=A0A5B7JFB7_PORTR|nr:hypothetical protein [Portunus trituberculatus]
MITPYSSTYKQYISSPLRISYSCSSSSSSSSSSYSISSYFFSFNLAINVWNDNSAFYCHTRLPFLLIPSLHPPTLPPRAPLTIHSTRHSRHESHSLHIR